MDLIWAASLPIASAIFACAGWPRHNAVMTSDTADKSAGGDPTYAFKPSLMGAMCQFRLRPDALEWQIGRHQGRVHYDKVRAVRLSFRPVTMQSQRFITEIWSTGNPKIQIVSASWRSMIEQEPLDAAYAAFVGELHRRLAAAGAAARFSTGLPVAVYWVGLIVFAAVMVATAVMLVRALGLQQWSAAAIVGVFFLVFAYQLGHYFYRNRPGRYRPDALPAGVLPKASPSLSPASAA